MSNALLGNFSSGSTGADMAKTFIGGGTVAAPLPRARPQATSSCASRAAVLTGPVDLKLVVTGGTTTPAPY